jgi:predicted  nucleic acid-binding Zn-ribbon protein
MHADLVKLLDLQAKDAVLSTIDERLATLEQDAAQLDQALQRAQSNFEAARRALADGQRRRDEHETRIESYRTLQERRKQRLDQVRNPKEASALMTELDLARSVLAQEENDWVRSADSVIQLEHKVHAEELALKAVETAQAAERAALAERRSALELEREVALRDRDKTALLIEKPLRTRYDRLRRSRTTDVVVPLMGGACGGCHTAVPLNRRSQIKSGAVVDGCEVCGAILYPSEPEGST